MITWISRLSWIEVWHHSTAISHHHLVFHSSITGSQPPLSWFHGQTLNINTMSQSLQHSPHFILTLRHWFFSHIKITKVTTVQQGGITLRNTHGTLMAHCLIVLFIVNLLISLIYKLNFVICYDYILVFPQSFMCSELRLFGVTGSWVCDTDEFTDRLMAGCDDGKWTLVGRGGSLGVRHGSVAHPSSSHDPLLFPASSAMNCFSSALSLCFGDSKPWTEAFTNCEPKQTSPPFILDFKYLASAKRKSQRHHGYLCIRRKCCARSFWYYLWFKLLTLGLVINTLKIEEKVQFW